jgi:hypothetical protein
MSLLARIALFVVSVAALVVAPIGSMQAQTAGSPERFTALAVNMGNFGPARAGIVEIVVSRWSTEAERSRLTQLLLDEGSDALLDALRDTPAVGSIRTPTSLAYDLHFALALPGEDAGRRIVLATDRPIGFWEAASQPRSIDYPFTLIELRLNRDGEGEGKMSLATRIVANKKLNAIELEDYANQPVRLIGVRSGLNATDAS